MADANREEKLAAARKKLKQFRQHTGKSSNDPSSVKSTPTDPVGNQVEINSSHPSRTKSQNIKIPVKNTDENSFIATLNESPNINTVYSSPEVLPQPGIKPTASVEALRQLSLQLNGLMSQTNHFLNGEEEMENISSVQELESRNQELATMLEKKTQSELQLNLQLQELKSYNSKLQSQLEDERKGFEQKQYKEQGSLKEQLQVHIQTIGILVAEKTELQSSLAQSQQAIKQKSAELEEFQGRLKASRQRVTELERSVTNTSTSSRQYEKTTKELSKEVDKLKLDVYKLNKLKEELEQQNSELSGKLQTKLSECQSFERSNEDLKSKLAMSELYVQQLSNQNNSFTPQAYEQIAQEKAELEGRIAQYNDSFQKISRERDELAEQYQRFSEQINLQNKQLLQEVKDLSEDKEKLLAKKSETENRIEELQMKLDTALECNQEINPQVTELSQQRQTLQQEIEKLNQDLQNQIRDNAHFSRLIEEKENKILELESTLSRVREDSVDKERLLETIQSDKVAVSRAIAQNKELKIQLAELQNGFVKLTNDNLDLTNQVQSEQHVSKELASRLGEQEDEINELRKQLSDKEVEIHQLKDVQLEISKQVYQKNQIADRMRHFEVQGQLSDMLQKELNAAQDRVNALTIQNNELRMLLSKAAEKSAEEEGGAGDFKTSRRDDMIDSLSASIRQLEMERNQIIKQYEEQREENRRLILEKDAPTALNGEIIGKESYDALLNAMQLLEERFTRAMAENADLKDSNQELEHVVMQLQGETDTIGEYVALYQTQRSALRQRAFEKDAKIANLARDKEDMKKKLGHLQDLVMKLLRDHQQLHPYAKMNPSEVSMVKDSKQIYQVVNGELEQPSSEDWPDIDGPDQDNSILNESKENENNTEVFSHWKISPNKEGNEDRTAQEIMQLLEEIGTSNIVEKISVEERNFLPCKFCRGKMMIV